LCGEQVSNTLQRTTASFLWTGKKQINGGNCLVAWEKVMRPINLGGLGIHNLEIMSWTLQMRWFWLEKIGAAQSWAGLRILVYHNASAMFAIAIESLVGNGRNTYFWTGRWLHGSYLEYLAPNVVSCVPLRFRKRRSIFEALQGIQCNLGWRGLAEYLKLWDMLGAVNLDNSISGNLMHQEYSQQNQPIRIFFIGAITFEPWKNVWKTWAPGKCKTFMWLAIRNRCWTADRLQKRGLPHLDHCLLCDQEEENIQHILTSCVFARQFWFVVLKPLNLGHQTPTRNVVFADWWKVEKQIQKQHMKGFNSLCIMGARILWKHRDNCVFEGASLLTVKIRQPSHEFTFGVGMSFIPYPLVLIPVV
jgi:hypothetical protein